MSGTKTVVGGMVAIAIAGTGLFWGVKTWQDRALNAAKAEVETVGSLKPGMDVEALRGMAEDLREAIAILEKTPRLPGQPVAVELAKLRYRLDDVEEQLRPEVKAKTDLEAAKKLAMQASVLVQNPPHPSQVWKRAQQKWEEAIALLEGIEPGTPSDDIAREKLRTYRQNRNTIVIRAEMSEQALRLNNIGIGQVRKKQYRDAIVAFDKAIRLEPKLVAAYINRGVAYSELGENAAAIASFNRALEIDPRSAQARYFRGSEYLEMSDYQKSLDDYTEALRLNPDYIDAYLDRGFVHKQLGEEQKAIINYQKAAEILKSQGKLETADMAMSIVRELQSSTAENSTP
ncbi:tetratricopeptide repeat protein [Lyngbya sp. CCY1209]|uniref:tetratricopeptide repeat protein n=1 Tax=Lyngbya sp. CCY1209 TaxID=2886103 RepID=UPI002D20D571|nr:tetratricopeptide repeat protein [Lyngbya sp. CCY1209]MEB3884193.1 tetratricopeptide repeat protein [Lyngbya sp. CCY1209]